MSSARDRIADAIDMYVETGLLREFTNEQKANITNDLIAIVREALLATTRPGDSSAVAVIEDALDAAFGKADM